MKQYQLKYLSGSTPYLHDIPMGNIELMNDTIFGMTEEELQAFNKAHDKAYPNQDYHLITLPEGMKIDVDKLEAEVKRGVEFIGHKVEAERHRCNCSRDQVVHFGCKCGGV